MTDDFWKDKIRAFLHDPPDKVTILSGNIPYSQHEKRVGEILQTAGLPRYRKDRGEGRLIQKSDLYTSSLQRIDLEKSKDGKKLSSQFYKVYNGTGYVYIGEPVLRHPTTGEPRDFRVLRGVLPQSEPIDKSNASEDRYREYKDSFAKFLEKLLRIEKEAFAELVHDSSQENYLKLWAYYPSKLREKFTEEFGEEFAEEFINLPAYSLAPDHSLFDHVDVTAAIYGTTKRGTPSLLMFKLSPVQGFIKNARKEKDLWAGSHMLAYLTFKAVEAIIERYGPDAVMYSHLRGNPFFEAYLHKKKLNDKRPTSLKVASLPNKFLALVPWEDVEELKEDIRERLHNELKEMFYFAWRNVLTDDVFEDAIKKLRAELEKTSGKKREKLKKAIEYLENLREDSEKEKLVNILLDHFTVTVTAIPINTAVPSEKADKEKSFEELKGFVKSLNLPDDVEEKYLAWLDFLGSIKVSDNVARPFDLYSLYYELLVELNAIESAKFKKPEEESGWKCTLCGEHLAVGGENRETMRVLWHAVSNAKPSLIKDNEYLCPVCLVKRLYPQYLKESKYWKNTVPQLRSVSEVAMRKRVKGKTTWVYVASCVLDPGKKECTECTEEILLKVRKLHDVLETLLSEVHNTENWENFFDVELFYTENLRDERAFLKTLGINREPIPSNLTEDLNRLREALKELYGVLGEPPKYYSILMMDGDRMGTLLMGDDMKTADEYLHPRVLEFVSDNVQEKARVTKRLITPSTHAAISRSLKNFSVDYATRVIEDGKGELIYTGGDDVLALLPTDTAFTTALKLEETFSMSWDGWKLLPGRTMSAGLLIVHYKHPLYDALDRVRALEGKAKRLGRNALAVGYLERSGSYYEATLGWEGLQKVKPVLRRILQNEGSKRFIYHIFEEIDGVPPEEGAIKAFLKFESIRHLNGDLSDELMEALPYFRLELGEEALHSAGVKSSPATATRLVNNLISRGELSVGSLIETLGIDKREDAERLYGEILKEQLRGFVNLLKILTEAGDEL